MIGIVGVGLRAASFQALSPSSSVTKLTGIAPGHLPNQFLAQCGLTLHLCSCTDLLYDNFVLIYCSTVWITTVRVGKGSLGFAFPQTECYSYIDLIG